MGGPSCGGCGFLMVEALEDGLGEGVERVLLPSPVLTPGPGWTNRLSRSVSISRRTFCCFRSSSFSSVNNSSIGAVVPNIPPSDPKGRSMLRSWSVFTHNYIR